MRNRPLQIVGPCIVSLLLLALLATAAAGCGDSGDEGASEATNSVGPGGGAGSGGGGTGGSSGTGKPLPVDPCVAKGTCPPGKWVNVTDPGMAEVVEPVPNEYGPGSIVVDPARPNAMYVGGSKVGLWKSEDYGNTFELLTKEVPEAARGVLIAVAGTTPPTLWMAGHLVIYKSADDAKTFEQFPVDFDLYSVLLDPYDNDHLVSGLHEVDGVAESTDGGKTWKMLGGTGFPTGGKSWYPFFIDTGDAATSRTTWIAIPQDGGGAVITKDGGKTWKPPNGLEGFTHAHGNARIHQIGQTLFTGGEGPEGWGVYRSTDLGDNWTIVENSGKTVSMVWGTEKNVYSMWAWACGSSCDLGATFQSSPMPGTTWAALDQGEVHIGPNSLVVSSDGTHNVFVGLMWGQGLWRYIEP